MIYAYHSATFSNIRCDFVSQSDCLEFNTHFVRVASLGIGELRKPFGFALALAQDFV